MNNRRIPFLVGAVVTTVVVALAYESLTSVAQAAAASSDAPQPVEPDMHEFMEYVFEPAFKRLRTVMATDPADNAAWKSIKADSLALAEAGNLLLIRTVDDDPADWAKHSVQVRDFGGKLYRAAKAKDTRVARENYTAMIDNCNACHKQFAGGEHQLKP